MGKKLKKLLQLARAQDLRTSAEPSFNNQPLNSINGRPQPLASNPCSSSTSSTSSFSSRTQPILPPSAAPNASSLMSEGSTWSLSSSSDKPLSRPALLEESKRKEATQKETRDSRRMEEKDDLPVRAIQPEEFIDTDSEGEGGVQLRVKEDGSHGEVLTLVEDAYLKPTKRKSKTNKKQKEKRSRYEMVSSSDSSSSSSDDGEDRAVEANALYKLATERIYHLYSGLLVRTPRKVKHEPFIDFGEPDVEDLRFTYPDQPFNDFPAKMLREEIVSVFNNPQSIKYEQKPLKYEPLD